MPVYFIEGVAQSPGNPNWPAIIQHAHDQNLRPLCGCINGNSKALLCIVRYDGGYYLILIRIRNGINNPIPIADGFHPLVVAFERA